MVAAVSLLMTALLLFMAAEVCREALHVDKEVMPHTRPESVRRTLHARPDMTAGGPDGPPTALELRLVERLAAPAPERTYIERWSTCQHDFPRGLHYFPPAPALDLAGFRECRDCGWAEGCAA